MQQISGNEPIHVHAYIKINRLLKVDAVSLETEILVSITPFLIHVLRI